MLLPVKPTLVYSLLEMLQWDQPGEDSASRSLPFPLVHQEPLWVGALLKRGAACRVVVERSAGLWLTKLWAGLLRNGV